MRKLLFIILLFGLQTSMASGLKDFEGQAQDLSAFVGKGQWSVVMIWAHDCPVCNEEVQAYDLFHLDHEEGDARVLGISLDGGAEAKAMEFIERHDLSFTNWIGDPRTVARMVAELTGRPLLGTPTFLIFDRGGKLRATQAGRLDPQLIEAFIAQQEGQKTPQ